MSFFFQFTKQPFLPTSSQGLLAWYDFTESAYLTLSSTAITQALDRSGNGNHTDVQGTAGARPTFAANQLNGRSLATFDGGDTLVLPSALYSLPNGNNTVAMVAKRNTEAGTTTSIFNMTEGGLDRYATNFASASGRLAFLSSTGVANVLVQDGNTNTDYQIILCKRSGTTQSISVNGGTATTNTGGASEAGVDAAYIGSKGGASQFLIGGIAEIIFYNTDLTTGQDLLLNTYFSNKYGIALV